MDFMVCVQHEPAEGFLAEVGRLGVGLELQSYGLGGVESPRAWSETLATHHRISAGWKGRRALHGPFLGVLYCHRDHLMRDAVRVRMDRTFEAVRELRPDTLVLHTGWSVEIAQFGFERAWLEETATFWRREMVRYEQQGVRVVLENVSEPAPGVLRELCERIDHPLLQLCLDVGHVNLCSQRPLTDWVAGFGEHLAHVHLHDNDGSADAHQPVGEGNIDFEGLFAALWRSVPEVTVSLEVEAADDERLRNLRDVLERFRVVVAK